MTDTYKKKTTAKSYNIARALPEKTQKMWMERLIELVPKESVNNILDLGGGTGRFAGLLQRTYNCPITVIDPSIEMLKQGKRCGPKNIVWICGKAEQIDFIDGSVDMVWMSQVYHHLEDKELALREIYRVLHTNGYLAIRNGTRENSAELKWMQCFPEAQLLDDARIPTQADIDAKVCQYGFSFIKMETVYQTFAASYQEYYEKISQRGLSSLISISDGAFRRGLRRLKKWVTEQPRDQKVYEPVDLFVFRKN